MDLLRFLLLLPVRLIRGLLAAVAWLLRPVVGQVSWSAPGWMHLVRRRPLHSAAVVLVAALFGAGGWFGWHWYKNRPRPREPQRITWEVHAPDITDYSKLPVVVHPLELDFSASTAPLELVGKPVNAGITMQPATKGQWTWVDDKTLRFMPASDWPVGQHYKVRFDVSQAFAHHVLLADDHFEFDTEPFKANIGKGEFYQDPQDPTAKKTIIQVDFNYPVDTAQFEKRIALSLAGRSDRASTPLKYSVTYDPYKLHAWIHSQPLDLPRDDGAVSLKLDSGMRSSRGGDGTNAELDTRVRVPGLYSLTVQDISPTLVDNDKYEPEQVMVINLSGAVRDSDLAGLVHAWVLPAHNPNADNQTNPDSSDNAQDQPYDWSASEASDNLLRKSQQLTLQVVPTENDYQALQSFKFHADPGQRIYVRIDKGLKSFGGYVLGAPATQVVTVPDYPKLLHFMADGSLLSLSGSKRISVVSRNMPGMRMEIGRVLPDQLQHLVSLNSGDYSHPQLPYNFGEEHIVDRFEVKRTFPTGDPVHAHYEGIDLSQYLQDGKRGVFLVHLYDFDPAAAKKQADEEAKAKALAQQGIAPPPPGSPPDTDTSSDDSASSADDSSNSNDSPQDSRLIVVTDLGMLVKRALDGSQDVFVQSIHTGQPVAGANVSVLAVNGQTLFSQDTGADGVVHFPTFKGLDREKQPRYTW